MGKLLTKTFLSWTIFSFMSLAIMILLFVNYIFTLETISQIFLVIITFVFFVGLFFSYKQHTLLYNEKQSLVTWQEDIRKESIGISIIYEVEDQHIDSGLNMPKEYVKIYESKVGTYLNIIVSLSNILITSGFLGTVFGLIVAMSGLREVMAISGSGSASTLLNEMKNILSGVDTAFYTTLFGAFGGGIALRINMILHNDILSGLVADIRSILIKVYSKHSVRSYDQEYKDFLLKHNDLQKLMSVMNENVNIINNNVKKLSETFQYLSKNVNAASSEISNTSENAVGKIDSLSDSLKYFFKDIYKFSKSLERITPIFSNNSNIISGNITSFSDKLLPELSAKLETFKTGIDHTTNSAKDLEASMKDIISPTLQKRLELIVETIEKNNRLIKEIILARQKE